MPVDYLHIDDDLMIANGDFVKGESTLQHQSLLIRLKKGELRQYPKTGVGIEEYLLDEEAGNAYAEVRKQFEADGMSVGKIEIFINESRGELSANIDAVYNE